jgi:hypothetical protein
MQIWHSALWGVIGGAVVEAYDTVAVVRATRNWPWLDPDTLSAEMSWSRRFSAFGLWLFAAIVRIAAGGGTAAAASSQLTGELGAFGLGVAGPLAMERLLAVIPVGPPTGLPSGTLTGRSVPELPSVTRGPEASEPTDAR